MKIRTTVRTECFFLRMRIFDIQDTIVCVETKHSISTDWLRGAALDQCQRYAFFVYMPIRDRFRDTKTW